jgi:hypothetical protein
MLRAEPWRRCFRSRIRNMADSRASVLRADVETTRIRSMRAISSFVSGL